MKLTEIRSIISQVIAEAKEKGGLPKSGGKLVHLKKELASLKQMQESVSQLTMNEANSQPLVAEYNHMQKYVNELEKIKMASAKLSEMLGNQISEVEGKISAETQKIKEMMGLVEPAAKKVEGKKAPKKEDKKEDKKEEPKKKTKIEKDDEKSLKEDAFYAGESTGDTYVGKKVMFKIDGIEYEGIIKSIEGGDKNQTMNYLVKFNDGNKERIRSINSRYLYNTSK